jgi:carboxymethylenebutenolidase
MHNRGVRSPSMGLWVLRLCTKPRLSGRGFFFRATWCFAPPAGSGLPPPEAAPRTGISHYCDLSVLSGFQAVLGCVKRPIGTELERSMQRKKASDFPQEVLNLFDKYVHGQIDRRAFLDGVQKFAVSGLSAAALFEMLRPNYAWAIQVEESDSRIRAQMTTVPSPKGNGSITGYLVRPAQIGGTLPGVLVIHENRGLNPYIKDVARRLAVFNYMAFAPDGLTPVGGYPGDDERGLELFRKVDSGRMREDFLAAGRWLKLRSDCSGKIGAVGFCFGGTTVNLLAVEMGSELAAAVPFYGGQPNAADAAKITAPLLAHYGELDTRITSGWPAFDAALTQAHVVHEGYIYPGASHGFHNDTTPRYDESAAKLAWQRTLDWLGKYVRNG